MATEKKTKGQSKRPTSERPSTDRPSTERPSEPQAEKQEEKVLEADVDSFPGSDAPAWTSGVQRDPTKPAPRAADVVEKEKQERQDDTVDEKPAEG